MGAVYLAAHKELGTRRALKVILPAAAASETQRGMFLREAQVLARLRHPNVIEIFDLVEPMPGIFCMVMEYVPGLNGEQLLEECDGRLPIPLACDLVGQALLGLAHLHERGVVHRDIKDANLLVGQDGAGRELVKVADCGLAKSYEGAGMVAFTSAARGHDHRHRRCGAKPWRRAGRGCVVTKWALQRRREEPQLRERLHSLPEPDYTGDR